jgi:hypothetical protein
MSCTHITNQLPLYYYGELNQEEEEKLEAHLASCAACSAELTRFRSFSQALLAAEAPVSERLLNQCRTDLTRSLRNESAQPRSWSDRFRELMNLHIGFRVPAGALALIAAGFFAGKLSVPGLFTSGAKQAGFVSVRSVEPDASGKVRIAFDSVSESSISGSADDPKIRELLLASMKDRSNAGLRVEAAGIMKDQAADADVRSALLEAVQHDPNVGVRINALEGLKAYSQDPAARKALTEVLLNDSNPGVRVKAIDLLTSHRDESMVGPLQNAMRKEDNRYVRMRIADQLRAMNASVGTF